LFVIGYLLFVISQGVYCLLLCVITDQELVNFVKCLP